MICAMPQLKGNPFTIFRRLDLKDADCSSYVFLVLIKCYGGIFLFDFFSRMFECREYVIQVLSNYTQVGIFFDETNLFSAISAQQTHVQHGLDNILLEKLSRSFYSRSLSALSVSVEYAVSFFYI